MRGRPRKPLESKLQEGTFRADRDGDLGNALLAAGQPVKPETLAPAAAALWDAVVPGLVERGVAGEQDTATLIALCEWWAIYRANVDRIYRTARGQPRKSPIAGKEARPFLIAAGDASRQFTALAARFGLTPADRARLKIPPSPPENDPYEEFMRGGSAN